MEPVANRRHFAEATREERPDLALLCLLIGVEAERHSAPRGSTPDDDGGTATESPEHPLVVAAQVELDRLAGQLPYAASRPPEAWARVLRELLGERLGFRGTPADYRRLDSSLLHAVLDRRRGLPITLSVAWIEVARRAGAPVYGVALPGHFMVGFGDPSGDHVLADPFDGGRPLTDDEAELLVSRATGQRARLAPALFQPADPLEIVLRVLNNIRAWAAGRPEQSAVQLWALDLALLLPHHPAKLRRDRAQLLVERGDFLKGAAELDEYAAAIGTMEPNAAEHARRSARAARSRLN
ncbi:transglutaminase-like domain-containing protein [Streptomyces sp. AJS327]|uniref:transglutaminase-like domain-containing protein n=1 Tax=Streptomyces sp. AJS327 TaxID=2545265 RepID=UPI0021556BB6|nr:transglutaminase-like domain-containing protein [Streptomyces sp. AJS327]